ncbi:MAG: CPBP family intramembrane metalloprotease [Clostridia bacterium]|nr:CPBP family intramembrane metalloprotease [Clostridia bacterium]
MTEELLPNENFSEGDILQKQAEREAAKKKMGACFNRVGWSIFTTMLVWLALLYSITAIVMVCDYLTKTSVLTELYNRYLLIINEATLAIAIAIGFFVIKTVPKAEEYRQPISVGRFMQILCICFAVSYIGNIIGTVFLTYWGMLTGNEVGNQLAEVLNMTDPLMMFLSVGLLAPILEELVFRKFLIDRMRPYGEVVSILVSAGLFALFHQNFSQFIYTFSAGVMLGFLYYKTGNYWLTTLLHAIFNCIGGVLPTLLLSKIMAFLEDFATLESKLTSLETEQEIMALLMPIVTEYGPTLLLYGIYLLILGAINITGIVFLIIRFRKYRAQKSELKMNAPETFGAIFKNPGMICTLILLGALTVMSLFMT